MSVSTVFLLLLIFTLGNAWAKLLPRRETVQGTRFEFLASFVHFINPGKFNIKEVSNVRFVQNVRLFVPFYR